MASENVKITINEVDLTKPGGAGRDISDIAFVPGFVNPECTTAPENVPVLCYDVYEFEKLFGKTPRILTTEDVTSEYAEYGFVPNTFDKSYIYAKELLLQGMPVIYSNIVKTNLPAVELTSAPVIDEESAEFFTVSTEQNKVALVANKPYSGTVALTYTTTFSAKGAESNIPSITTYEAHIEGNDCDILDVKIKLPKNTKTLKFIQLSDAQIEVTSSSCDDQGQPIDQEVTIEVTVTAAVSLEDLDEKSSVSIEVNKNNGSCLDVFYGEEDLNNPDAHIRAQLQMISDKSIYSVKYITSGGYPSVVSSTDVTAVEKFSTQMLKCAADRGDAVALIDYQMNESEAPFAVGLDEASFYSKMHRLFNHVANAEYGAMMYPWGLFSCGGTLSSVPDIETVEVYMPASFAYMKCLAKAIKTSPNWLAMAGVTRGLVPGLSMIMTPHNVLSNTVAEEMQPKFGVENHRISINCVTNIRPYGLTLWGNRTLKPVSKDGCVALNFLNTRNMLSDIKKVLYSTAKSLMFEQNSDTLWLKFKAGITPLLNQLKTGNGISDYKIVKGTTKYNGDPLQKGELAAVIKIYPMYAVEYFELTVELNDEEVTVL